MLVRNDTSKNNINVYNACIFYFQFVFFFLVNHSTDVPSFYIYWRIWFRVHQLSHHYLHVLCWLHIRSSFQSTKVWTILLSLWWIWSSNLYLCENFRVGKNRNFNCLNHRKRKSPRTKLLLSYRPSWVIFMGTVVTFTN